MRKTKKQTVPLWLTRIVLLLAAVLLLPRLAIGQDGAATTRTGEAAAMPMAGGVPQPLAVNSIPAVRQAENLAVITIEGPIFAVTSKSFERRFDKAINSGADAIVIELDTPGGEVGAVLEITQLIKNAGIYTTAWVNPDAYSGGAIIALACDEIVLAQGATMGDAAPIASNPLTGIMELPETERSKILSPLIAEVVDSARLNGYDENVVMGFLQLGVELWLVEHNTTGKRYLLTETEYTTLFEEEPQRGTPMVASGSVGSEVEDDADEVAGDGTQLDRFREQLGDSKETEVELLQLDLALEDAPLSTRPSFTPETADEYTLIGYATDGRGLFTLKPAELRAFGLAAPGVTISTDADLKAHHGSTELARLNQSWSEGLVYFLNYTGWGWGIRGLLIVVFIVALFVELALPGTGGGGMVATLALVGLLAPPLLIGAHAWWALALILLGIALLALELFVFPGIGVPAFAGIVCVVVGLVGTFAGAGQLFPGSGAGGGSPMAYAFAIVIFACFTSLIAMFFLSKYTQVVPIANKLILDAPQPVSTEVGVNGARDDSDAAAHVGDVGVTTTPLHPSGTAEFEGRLVDVVAEEGFIEQGKPVRVVSATVYRVGVLEVAHASGEQTENNNEGTA